MQPLFGTALGIAVIHGTEGMVTKILAKFPEMAATYRGVRISRPTVALYASLNVAEMLFPNGRLIDQWANPYRLFVSDVKITFSSTFFQVGFEFNRPDVVMSALNHRTQDLESLIVGLFLQSEACHNHTELLLAVLKHYSDLLEERDTHLRNVFKGEWVDPQLELAMTDFLKLLHAKSEVLSHRMAVRAYDEAKRYLAANDCYPARDKFMQALKFAAAAPELEVDGLVAVIEFNLRRLERMIASTVSGLGQARVSQLDGMSLFGERKRRMDLPESEGARARKMLCHSC